jgi:cell division protein FtsB
MRKRIYSIASETKRSNQEILEAAQQLGFSVTTASSSLSENEEAEVLAFLCSSKVKPKKGSKENIIREAAPQVLSEVKAFTESYEKKSQRKERPPKVKTVSQRGANRFFAFILFLIAAVMIGLGGFGIASGVRMNQLVKETNQDIQQLNKENDKQNQLIQQLQQGVKP